MSYVGSEPLQRQTGERYFYALRRDDDGQLFIAKVDVASPTDAVAINKPGGTVDNFPDFQDGADFFEGRNPNHNLVYDNLNFEQMRWDDKNIYYFINDEGEFVLRINTPYTYTSGISDNFKDDQFITGY
ncbi:uncharacterized protein METZ01_LOCUS50167 [marine metagenome]|uniref:Uncharacterized protein n=1 Tax=marine metagenome TaxID=408172 RepID=A0A381S896_9ZZZZ